MRLLIILMTLGIGTANAEMFKCKNAMGKVSYSQKKCKEDRHTEKFVIKNESKKTVSSRKDKQMELVREKYLKDNIIQIAEENFPDNVGLEWVIHSFTHKDHISFVEVEPRPNTVGYQRFKFVVSFIEIFSPRDIATYCLENDRYTLFSTRMNLGKDLGEGLPYVLP